MRADYIVLAIPAFLLLIGVELLVAHRQGKRCYRLADSISDLSCGMLQQLTLVFAKTALLAGYLLVYERLRVFTIPVDSPAAWVSCFLAVDFLYYWFHRTSHEVNALWAAHVVHHQSEDYNLAVALRQSSLQAGFSSVFYLPLAILGCPPAMFVTLAAFNTLYQFWIHTRTIGRLGPLEWVLNTPSHHRVHHARNPKYIDRNHGGTLIVWDRIFGTFRAEEEEPVYGITKPLASWNPLWANLHYWAELLGRARRTRRWRDRLRLFLARPGWRPEELGGYEPPPPVERSSHRKWDTPLTAGMARYALVQFAVTLAATSAFLFVQGGLPFLQGGLPAGVRIAVAAAIAVSLVALGGLLEGRRWAFGLEAARLVAAAGLGGVLAAREAGPGAAAVVALFAGAMLLWLLRERALRPRAPSPA